MQDCSEISYVNFRTEHRVEKFRKVIEKRQPELTVVLENVHDPHNVSAVIRTCDAVGVYEACFVYHSGQKYPKLGEKSSASARKWVNQRHFPSIADCINKLHEEGKKVYTTHMGIESVSLYELDFTVPCALVFGNEHSGVSEDAVKMADANFLIPQVGMLQSLNISVAAAVSLYEAFRQRQSKGMYHSCSFSDEIAKNKLEEWLKK